MSGPPSPPFVSVVVPVRDDPGRLARCLAALIDQTYPADRFEVVVADSASSVDLRPSVPDDPRFILQRVDRPGSYAARNAALDRARGDIVAFTDADCVPARDWLAAGVAALDRDPSADAVGGRIVLQYVEGVPRTAVEVFESVHGFPQRSYVENLSFAATANLVVRASALHHVGRFDEALLSGGDVEWGRRLERSGGRLVYADDVLVEHPARSSWRELRTKTLRVANGLADGVAADVPRRKLVAETRRNLAGAAKIWLRVWRLPQPRSRTDKLRYAAAFSYVRILRAWALAGRIAPARRPLHAR